MWLFCHLIFCAPFPRRDGVLLLQVTGRDETKTHYAKHAFLSYNYSSNGSLLVESHRVAREPKNYFDEAFPFTDSAFSFVWVDFRNPLTPTADTYTGEIDTHCVRWIVRCGRHTHECTAHSTFQGPTFLHLCTRTRMNACVYT